MKKNLQKNNMIDFHAHILPCADHGSKNIETSLKQVNLAKRAGISTIVATPHFYMNSDNIEAFVERREKSYNELMTALKQHNIDMNIVKASEVTLEVDLFKIKDFSPLCIGNTNYMLLEMPMDLNWTPWHYSAVDELVAIGVEPIIAHINRYPTFYLNKLFEKDVLFQVNVEAFKHFSSRMKLIKKYNDGFVNLIGSDVHHFSMDTYYEFKKYSSKYPKIFEELNANAKRILNIKNGN